MTGSASSIRARVLAAYRSSRDGGADEWTACEKALEVFCRAHPDASADFANTFVSEVLREAYPPDRVARLADPARGRVPTLPALRRAAPRAGRLATAARASHRADAGTPS
ncbi:hypothetical protein KXR53_15650 [Inquilinus limosus]|uniref:hypothetical protein n=1 Tax=Inquilinus limosus TaxID=171674 RepID=UPI003F191F2C